MKQLFFWLIILIFLFFIYKPIGNHFLTKIAVEQFESWMESESARKVFDLEEEEAIAVFGQTAEEIYL